MKKIYVILVAVLLVGSISAQAQLKFGVKGGLNLSKINSTNADSIKSNQTGWHAGLMAEVKMPMVGIEADVLYSQSGSEVNAQQVFGNLKNTYVTIPVVVKYYIVKVVNIQAGPQFSWLTSSKFGVDDVKDQLQSNDLQIVFGAGVDLSVLHATLRYTLGVKDINKDLATYDMKNNAVMLSVGIWLKK